MAAQEEEMNFNLEEFKKIKKEYKTAKEILKKIDSLNITFNVLYDKINDKEGDMESRYNLAKERANEVENIKNSSADKLLEIKNNLTKVKSNIEELQISYTDFVAIKGDIKNSQTEIKNLVDNSKTTKKETVKIKDEAQITLDLIKKSLGDVQKKLKEMEEVYQDFLVTKGQIFHKKEGLQAVINQTKAALTQSKKLQSEIQSFRDESSKLLEGIRDFHSNSEDLKNKITENLDISNQEKEIIKKMGKLIGDSAFANSFHKRAQELSDSGKTWKTIFFLSTLLLGVFLIFLFYPFKDMPDFNTTIFRLTLTSPFLFIIGVSLTQYSKEREYNEKYAFKGAAAEVVRSHINYLLEKDGLDNTEISKFATETMSCIYKEPYVHDKKVEKDIRDIKDKIKNINKNTNNNFDIKNLTEEAKELKSLFTDDKLLGKVVDLMLKIRK